MNLELNKVNVLPVKTWSWLRVNHLTLSETIPDIVPYEKNVINWNQNDENKLLIQQSNDEFDSLFQLETGMGEEAVDFIKQNKNKDILICVPKGEKIEKPIFINYELKEEESIVDLNRIIAEEDSQITIVLSYKNENNKKAFHGGLTFLEAKKNAVINLVIVQLLNDESIHLNDIATKVGENATINITQAELGGSKVALGLRTQLLGNESKQYVNSIYFGDKERFIDINYIVNHIGRFTISDLKLNGALLDEGRKLFRGTIDFKKGAVGASGAEEEFNLLFSPKIKNITAPLILCGEENVEGKHGANSGKILEEQLFYMMSRGIDELTAKKIMIESSFAPVIERVPDEELKNEISDYVKGRLLHVKQI